MCCFLRNCHKGLKVKCIQLLYLYPGQTIDAIIIIILLTRIGSGVHVYCLHPGLVHTELGRTIDQVYFPGMRFLARFFLYPWMKTPEQGAQTTLHCSIDEKAGEENGLYYRFDTLQIFYVLSIHLKNIYIYILFSF